MFTVTVTTQDVKTGLAILDTLNNLKNVDGKATELTVSDSAPTKRGRQAKKEAKQMDLQFGDDDGGEEDTTQDESEETQVEETATEASPEQVMAALQAYAKKHSREKAKALVPKILAKYDVESVRELNASQCESVLATLAKR